MTDKDDVVEEKAKNDAAEVAKANKEEAKAEDSKEQKARDKDDVDKAAEDAKAAAVAEDKDKKAADKAAKDAEKAKKAEQKQEKKLIDEGLMVPISEQDNDLPTKMGPGSSEKPINDPRRVDNEERGETGLRNAAYPPIENKKLGDQSPGPYGIKEDGTFKQ